MEPNEAKMYFRKLIMIFEINFFRLAIESAKRIVDKSKLKVRLGYRVVPIRKHPPTWGIFGKLLISAFRITPLMGSGNPLQKKLWHVQGHVVFFLAKKK